MHLFIIVVFQYLRSTLAKACNATPNLMSAGSTCCFEQHFSGLGRSLLDQFGQKNASPLSSTFWFESSKPSYLFKSVLLLQPYSIWVGGVAPVLCSNYKNSSVSVELDFSKNTWWIWMIWIHSFQERKGHWSWQTLGLPRKLMLRAFWKRPATRPTMLVRPLS